MQRHLIPIVIMLGLICSEKGLQKSCNPVKIIIIMFSFKQEHTAYGPIFPKALFVIYSYLHVNVYYSKAKVGFVIDYCSGFTCTISFQC